MNAHIYLCGELRVEFDGANVTDRLPARQGRLLFAYLVLSRATAVRRDELFDAIWPERSPRDADAALASVLARVRRVVGPERLPPRGPLQLRLGDQAWVDVEAAHERLTVARNALDAGQADGALQTVSTALAIVELPLLAEFEGAWLDERRRRLTDLIGPLVEVAVEAGLRLGGAALARAELIARRGVEREPFRETTHGALMRVLAGRGDSAEALRVFDRLRTRLRDELGVPPSRGTLELHERLLTGEPGRSALDTPAPTTAESKGDTHAHGRAAELQRIGAVLPAPATGLFGRDADLERLTVLIMQPDVCLATLVGPGGVGKTRLAIEAALRLAGRFPDGMRFVALAPLSDSRELASAIAVTLPVPLQEDEPPASTVLRFCADRRLLLVLDNFEHLLAGASLVGELLASCPQLTILVTSREPTRLAAERLYPVRALELPEASGPASAALERYAAVALFCDRARARDPDFVLDAGNAPHVRAICHRLDGLPLALELAAARMGVLSPAELAARLSSSLAVLTSGARDAPDRQRTLRAMIDWSFRLLEAEERSTFARFAVFSGGATVAAAEAVTDGTLDTLDSLIAKHLIVRQGGRLSMLETVHEYALERLADEPDADAVYERLGAGALATVSEATPHLVRETRVAWLARLEPELPNALSALSWALEQRRADLAMRLAVALGEYWWRANRWHDGLPWLNAALERADATAPAARAWLLLYRARLTGARRYERYRADVHAALALFRACDDAAGLAASLAHAAVIDAWVGDFQQAAVTGDHAIRLATRSGDDAVIAVALTERVVAAADFKDGSVQAHRAVSALHPIGNLIDLGVVCSVAGFLAIRERQYREALAWLDEAVDAACRLNDPRSILRSRGNQGLARLFVNDLDGAQAAFSDALASSPVAPGEHLLAQALLGMAAVAARRGQITRAARLAGVARRHAIGKPHRHEQVIWARVDAEILTPARAASDGDAWDRDERQGASLTAAEGSRLARCEP